MPVTINVNGLSLIHQGSGGKSSATLPDVCLKTTPSGPVPIPYQNTSYSKDLANGTKTIKVDGGNSAAIDGSEFSVSEGDEAGDKGGVKSGTQMKESTWLTFSFDVRFEGKGACRLSDKMLHNHGNTVNLGGAFNPPIAVLMAPINAKVEAAVLCEVFCYCNENPLKKSIPGKLDPIELRQDCVRQTLEKLEAFAPQTNTMKPEISYNMMKNENASNKLKIPPKPFMHRLNGQDTTKPSEYWQGRAKKEVEGYHPGMGHVRRPDVVVVKDPSKPPYQDNLKAVVEMKFPKDTERPGQYEDYKEIAGKKNKFIIMDIEKCGCKKRYDKPDPVPVPFPIRVPKDIPNIKKTPELLDKIGKYGDAAAFGLVMAALAVALIPGGQPIAAGMLLAGVGVKAGAGSQNAGITNKPPLCEM